MSAPVWATNETFEVINVLTSTEERYANARWHADIWLYPEDSLAELLAAVPLVEPINLTKVDWKQVVEVIREDDRGPSPHPATRGQP